jgi:hypothetical protein
MVRVFVAQRRIHPSLYGMARELARRDPEIAESCERIEKAHRERIRFGIASGQEAGIFRSELDPETASRVLQPLMQTAISQIAEAPPEIDAEPALQALTDLVCSYLLCD